MGALGKLRFPIGTYIYVGSAMTGLQARVQRHTDTSRGVNRTVHWHIDYLLRETEVEIETIYIQETDRRTECDVATAILQVGKPVKGFGCSDCHCISHLFKVDECEFLNELGLRRTPISDFIWYEE